jgi:hypothetical protein
MCTSLAGSGDPSGVLPRPKEHRWTQDVDGQGKASGNRCTGRACWRGVEFTPLEGSTIGELAARFDIVLGVTPESR